MNKAYIQQWFKDHFESNTVKLGSQLLISLSVFAEETRPTLFSSDNSYIKPENILEIISSLESKGWSEVILDQNLLEFISDVDDVLTVISFK